MSIDDTVASVPAGGATVNAENPWPGLLAFRETDQNYFQGRCTETEELFRMVMRERLVVLFGLSGLGKSSLLQAGLFPRLRPEKVLPVSVRLDFSDGAFDFVKQIKATVGREASLHHIEAPPPRNGETLWEYFHRDGNSFWNARNRPVMPLLAFDQFEEIFTLGRLDPVRAAATEALLEQLADVAEGRPPAALKLRIDQHPEKAAAFHFGRHHYKILLSIREDFLPDLESLRARMPALALNRLRLRRMNGEAALHVVSQAEHLIDIEVARQVVRFVAADRGAVSLDDLEVEPALLSVVCRELNNKRLHLGEDRITAGLLEGSQQQVLADFYERSTVDLPPQVRLFIEDHLLTVSGYRDSVALENALNVPGMSRHSIDELVERRLVRREDRGGVQRLELTHDLLAGVVRASRDTRRLKEETERERLALIRSQEEQQQALLKAREEEQLRLQRAQERETAKRTRFAAGVFLVLMLFAAAAAVWAWIAQSQANQLRKEAEEQKARALGAASAAEKARGDAERQKSAADVAKDEAAASAVVSSARELATAALLNLTSDPELSLLLALAASDKSQTPETLDVLHQAVHASRARFSLPVSAGSHEISVDQTGTHIAITEDGKLTTWDVSGPSPKRSQRVLSKSGGAAAFTQDGKMLAVSGGSGILLWSVPENRLVGELDASYEELAFSPDGRFLAGAACDLRELVRLPCSTVLVDVWDIPARKRVGQAWPFLAGGGVHALAWLSDSLIASGGRLGRIAVWSNEAGSKRKPTYQFNDANAGPVNVLASPGSSLGLLYAAAGSNDVLALDAAFAGKVKRWTGHTGAVQGLARSAGGPLFATASADRTARIWDSRTDQERLILRGHKEEIRKVAFSGDGKRLVTQGPDALKIWNVAANGELASWSDPAGGTLLGLSGDGRFITVRRETVLFVIDLLSGSTRTLTGTFDHAPVSRYGRLLAHSVLNTVVVIEDQKSGRKLPSPAVADGFLFALDFSGNGGRLLMITDGPLRVWDLALARYMKPPAAVMSRIALGGAISDDGQRVAWQGEDKDDVFVWNIETDQVSKMASGADDKARFALSPDGRWLAGSAADGKIILWDTRSGRILRRIAGHAGPATALAFSANGNLLASGGGDKITRIWDVATGQQKLSLPGHTEPVRRIAFGPDAEWLTTAAADGEALVYALNPRDLMKVARTRVTRPMTVDECRKFLHLDDCSANARPTAQPEGKRER